MDTLNYCSNLGNLRWKLAGAQYFKSYFILVRKVGIDLKFCNDTMETMELVSLP